jgi:hypothetical protein
MRRAPAAFVAALLLAPAVASGQVSIQGGVQLGRAEHRVTASNLLIPSSGTLFGGTVAASFGRRFIVQGEAFGGQLVTGSTPSLEDHSLAEAQILGGMQLRSWLILQSGITLRNFSNSLARQHWTTWRLGAQARFPLGFEGVTAELRGYWLPVVAVSGLPQPDVAIAAAVGLEWRRRRLAAAALYTLERYDFSQPTGPTRLEELSSLRLRLGWRWRP